MALKMTTRYNLQHGRRHSTRKHCFHQRKDAVHPRWISAAQRDNTDQVRLIGISLPKPDVTLDQTLIYTIQS
jgi:hypothetical protein